MNPVATALEQHKSQGTFRELRATGTLGDFSSNDYLGLSFSSKVRAKLLSEIENGCPLGATGSRLLSGQTEIHARVEEFLQRTFQASSALLFSSGFMANLGVMTAFSSLDAHFFSDEQNHASLIDGMRTAKTPKSIFRHNDLLELEEQLAKARSPLKVIVTESVFSMGGDLAPLKAMYALARRFNAWLVVDEAHATGVFGDNGLGCLAEFPPDPNVVSIHTGGKALGGQGAFVLSSHEFRELMINRARSFIFSTGLSPLSALQMQFALEEVLAGGPNLGKRLLERARSIARKISDFGMTVAGESQIVPVILGSNEKAMYASGHLREAGFDVRPIRSPTVPRGSERLRITVKSFHDEGTIQNFLSAMKAIPK